MVFAPRPPACIRDPACIRRNTVLFVYDVDCPSSVTVSPSSGPFKADDVLTCTSDGYPVSYEWTDSNGRTVSKSRTTRLFGGVFSLTCTVNGSLDSPKCSTSKTISGNATG